MDLDTTALLVAAVLVLPPFALLVYVLATTPFVRGPEDTFFVACLRRTNLLYVRWMHRYTPLPGGDPLPAQGPCIVVANHRSGADPSLVAASTRRWIHFLMAREYFEARGLSWMFRRLGCIPVNRDGTDFSATRAALRALRQGQVIGIFPQGGIRAPSGDGDEGKAGVALLALRTGAPVVPLYVEGSPPHVESVLWDFLRRSRSSVRVGSPLRFDQREGKPSREELESCTERVMEAIQGLAE